MTKKTAVTSFVLLCALALAIPASAQVSFNVTSSAQTVRTEGQTETAGSVNMNWASGAAISAGSSITLTYASAAVTSVGVVTAKLAGTACTVGTTCAGMTAISSGASVIISFTAQTPATAFAAGDFIQVAQVRLNVAGFTGAQLVTGTTNLNATISGSSPSVNTVTFNQSQVQVAFIQNSLNVSKATSGATTTCAVAATPFSITVAEVFPAALTSAADEALFTPSLAPAPTATTLNFVFTNVPPGLQIAPAAGFITGTGAVTVTAAPAAQTSASAATPLTFTATVAGTTPSTVEKPIFNWVLSLPGAGTTVTPLATNGLTSPLSVTAQVYLGPVTNTAATIVRFTQLLYPAAPFAVATVSDCVTNLLFPYHNAANGFDTSYALANTSEDDFIYGAGGGAKAVSGTCKLTLFTSDLAGATTGTQTVTTPTIPAGGVVAFSSASGGGGVPTNTSFNGQAGYVIAQCNFQNAHGYALVTNGNASVVPTGQQYAVGYLGLVLGAGRPTGENLTH